MRAPYQVIVTVMYRVNSLKSWKKALDPMLWGKGLLRLGDKVAGRPLHAAVRSSVAAPTNRSQPRA
jgi:hypothetical protein